MTNRQNEAPHISVNAQYIKDLSFENPSAPNSLVHLEDKTPHIELFVDLGIASLPEKNYYEVELNIEIKATVKDAKLFIVDLRYAGIFNLINIPIEQHETLLAVHCPAMLFPFARKIISGVTQDGGFQPLMIDPIDFMALYHKKITDENSN